MDFNLGQGDRTELGSKETRRFTGTSVATVTSNEDSLKCSQNSTFSLRPAEPSLGAWLAHGRTEHQTVVLKLAPKFSFSPLQNATGLPMDSGLTG